MNGGGPGSGGAGPQHPQEGPVRPGSTSTRRRRPPPPSQLAPPAVGLTDTQKASLARLWTTHSADLDSHGHHGGASAAGDGVLGGCGSDLDNRTYLFVARLYSFFTKTIESAETVAEDSSTTGGGNATDATITGSRTFDSLRHLLHVEDCATNGSTLTTRRRRRISPRIMSEGRRVIQFDHNAFDAELNRYELPQLRPEERPNDEYIQQHSFGSFLYHLPERALAAVGCAIGLTLTELIRRSLNSCPTAPIGRQQQQQMQQMQQQEKMGYENIRRILDVTRYYARFGNVYPLVRMVDIKTNLAYRFITVKGHVTKAKPKRLRVVTADFQCGKCGEQFPHRFNDGRYVPPDRCPSPKCRSRNFTICRSTARYVDVQQIRLQETQDETTVDAGRAPRQIDVEVTDELVDSCHAGDVIHVAGIVRAVNSAVAAGRGGKRAQETSTYKLYLTANSIVNTTSDHARNVDDGVGESTSSSSGGQNGGATSMTYTSEQLARIVQLAHADHMYGPMSARMAFPFDLLVRSICPSIIGHDLVKAGILLGLLGGTPPGASGVHNMSAGMTIRSNIHVLIVGDPGMGKSQMLLAATQVVSRSIYVGGNTASTTGLTVSMSKESSGEVGIEAGALVLADQGVCCIDEFDKMERTHQDGLLEAMEQQQVSIAKAGVVASLPARCSIIAAANPKHGSYNLGRTVAENLNMASPLLSRFDLVFILLDQADVSQDQKVSSNIMNLYRQQGRGHTSSSGQSGGGSNSEARGLDWTDNSGRIPMMTRLPWVAETQRQPLPADLVRDYIAYAREYCHPKMTPAAAEVLKAYFMELRYPTNHNKDNVPITTRQLEALIRLSQARAKACLRDFVLKEDADDVVELMRESVRQVHVTNAQGHVDKSRGGAGGTSNRKARKAFQKELERIARMKSGQGRLYTSDIYTAAKSADLGYDIKAQDLIENMREDGIVIKQTDRNEGSVYKVFPNLSTCRVISTWRTKSYRHVPGTWLSPTTENSRVPEVHT